MKQKSHKLLSLLLAFALMLSLAPAALAADECPSGGTHNWGEWKVDKEPTCVAQGSKSRTCSKCTATGTETIGIVDHSWQTKVDQYPTCTEKGKRTKTCSVCEKTETEEIAARGHTYTTYTDNKDGKQHTKTCDVCNNAIVENHTFGTAGTAIKCTLCGAANPNATQSITLNQTTATISVNGSVQLTATVYPTGTAVTWSSNNPTVAGVSVNGLVTGRQAGTATITATTSSGAQASCTVTVQNTTDFYITPASTTLYRGQTVQLRTVPSTSVTWRSSNNNIANVDYLTGLVTAVANGTATITATETYTNRTATCVIYVNSGSSVLTASPSSVSISSNSSAYSVSVSTTSSYRDGYVRWSLPSNNGYAEISDTRSSSSSYWGYAETTYFGSSSSYYSTNIYIRGIRSGHTTLTATLYDSRGNRVESIDIPVYVDSTTSHVLSAYPSTITTNSNGWSGAVYVSTPTTAYDDYIVDWSTSSSNIRISTRTNTSDLGTTARTYMDGRTSGSVYVYDYGYNTTNGYLTATLRRTAGGTAIDTITIPVNNNRSGFTLSKNPNTSSVNLGYYDDDYYWDYDRYSYRDFSVTPYLNGTSIYNNSTYDIYYTWTLNNTTVQRESTSGSSYRLYADNSSLYSSSRNNTLTCSVSVYYRNASTTTANRLYSSSASWTVYTDRYYNDYTVSATVYDSSSSYCLDDRDDRGNTSIITQMQNKLSSSESIDYVRFHDVTDTYGDLSASTSRDYYYSGSRNNYDLREVTFTPDRIGTATFDCTVYGTRGNSYRCTISIKVEAGSSSKKDITYSARAGSDVSFSASDFQSWWRNSYSRGDLDYVRFSSPSGGSLYINYNGSNSSTVGSTYCYYNPSSRQTGISDLTFVPSSSSTKSATISFTAYGTTSSSSSSNTSMSGKVSISFTNTSVATISYSATGTRSVSLSASDFTSRYRDVVGSSAPSNMTIKFRSTPSHGTLAYGSTNLTSSNMSSYNFTTSSSGSNRINDVKYTPKNNSNSTDTVNYDCYTGSTLRFSGTVTFNNKAENTAPANVTVSYSTTGSYVNFNAADFYNKNSAMLSASYLTFGTPTSGSLYVGSSVVSSGTKFAYVSNPSANYQNLGSVTYRPAAGFSGTATISFTAYNSNGTQAATGTVSIQVSQATTPNRTSFNDVPSTAWYYNDVTTLAKANIVNGRNDGLFHPNDAVNYGEGLKLILLAAGYPLQQELSGSNWAQNYLNLAISNGLLPGTAASYSLSAPMNRTTIATVAAKALKLSPVTNEASPYADAVDAEGYVLALTKAGIVQGDASSGKQLWNGSDNLTRAQISRIVYNVYKYRNVAPGGGSTSTDTSKPGWLN